MAERKPAKKGPKGTAKRTTAPRNSSTRFTAEERAAVKEHARELKASSKGRGGEGSAREDRGDEGARSGHGQATPRGHPERCPRPRAEDVVRDACLRQGRQGPLLLPRRS